MKFPRSSRSLAPFAVIGAAVLWSFDGLLRRSLYSLQPSVIVFYEHLFGGLVLLLLARWWWPGISSLTRREWGAIGVVSFLSGALGTVLYTAAIGQVQYIPYSVVVLLQQLEPLWAIGAAHVLLKERVTKKFFLWVVLALVSAYLLSFRNLAVTIEADRATAVAALLAIGAAACWGTSTAISKMVLNKTNFLTATALRFLITPLFAGLFILLQNQTNQLVAPTSEQWQALTLITFSTGMVALALYYFGLKQLPARVTTLLELAWPASAVVIDYVVFDSRFTLTQIAGMVLLAFTLYQVQKSKHEK